MSKQARSIELCIQSRKSEDFWGALGGNERKGRPRTRLGENKDEEEQAGALTKVPGVESHRAGHAHNALRWASSSRSEPDMMDCHVVLVSEGPWWLVRKGWHR
jgi:hypothetical protein